MYTKYRIFLESLDEYKDINWFLDKLGAVKMDIAEYMGVSKAQRRFELDEYINIKNVMLFLNKFDVKFGEIFDSREIYTPLDIELVWVFLLPKDEDQTADPKYVLYKEKNKLIRLAMVTKDDYNVYKPLNKDSGNINEKYQSEVNHYERLKKEAEV